MTGDDSQTELSQEEIDKAEEAVAREGEKEFEEWYTKELEPLASGFLGPHHKMLFRILIKKLYMKIEYDR